jgi:ABC-2 type transport system ATP-binding protein
MSLLDVQSIAKTYRKRKSNEVVKAVDDVSFSVVRGEILGLLGPNGAGKTTTIKMICGLIRPDRGRITINSFDNQRQRLKALRHISAVLEGNRNLYWRMSVKENLEYFAGNRGKSRAAVKADISKLLEQFRLTDKRDELVSNLSRGMGQKLAMAVAMLANTDLILLDEPTLGLDVETGYEVRELLRQISKEGRTIIISTHDMPVVQDLCERTVIINQGHVVVDDRVSNLLKLFETRAYTVTLGKPLSVTQHHLLQQSFPVVNIENGEKETLTVNLEHGEDIYNLMDILRSEQTPVETIDRAVINFEQVFRKLIRKETFTGKEAGEENHVLA